MCTFGGYLLGFEIDLSHDEVPLRGSIEIFWWASPPKKVGNPNLGLITIITDCTTILELNLLYLVLLFHRVWLFERYFIGCLEWPDLMTFSTCETCILKKYTTLFKLILANMFWQSFAFFSAKMDYLATMTSIYKEIELK